MGHQFHRSDARPIRQPGRRPSRFSGSASAAPSSSARAAQVGTQHPVAVGGQRADQLVPLSQFSGKPCTGITFGGSGVGDVNRDTTPRIDEVVLDAIQGRQSNHGLTI
jgi:hypothetical protein